jgi:hypothetical protein
MPGSIQRVDSQGTCHEIFTVGRTCYNFEIPSAVSLLLNSKATRPTIIGDSFGSPKITNLCAWKNTTDWNKWASPASQAKLLLFRNFLFQSNKRNQIMSCPFSRVYLSWQKSILCCAHLLDQHGSLTRNHKLCISRDFSPIIGRHFFCLALTDPATYQALHWLLLVFQDSWPKMQAVVLNGFALLCFSVCIARKLAFQRRLATDL